MFKSLKIENIQSHIHTEIDFDPGVNVIVGNSDQGKSALFNGIYWNLFHRPLGDPHRNWDGGTMLSQITLENNTSVTLTKKKQSIYTIEYPDGNIDEFKAFGAEPPDEIKAIFNINRKINIQKQLEIGAPIFLISESPGDVAKFFNKVAGLYKITEVTKLGESRLKKADNAVTNLLQEIKDKKSELKSYEGIDDSKALVDSAKEIHAQIKSNRQKINDLSKVVDRISRKRETIEKLKEKLIVAPLIKKTLESLETGRYRKRSLDDLQSIVKKIKRSKRIIKNSGKKVAILPDIEKALILRKTFGQLETKEARIFRKLTKLKRAKQSIKTSKAKAKELHDKFLHELPSKCPICGSKTSSLKHKC